MAGSSVWCEDGTLPPSLGTGWMLYMVNGVNSQYKNSLIYGTNSNGVACNLGSFGSGFPGRCSTAYKLAESFVDGQMFTEVLATTTDNNQFVLVTKKDGSAFAASQLFGISSSDAVDLVLYDSSGSVLQSRSQTSTSGHGPLWHDPFGAGHGWMWTTNGGTNDLRKGNIPGANTATDWLWWGRPAL